MAPTYTHPDFARWERELLSARNTANGKPLQNNTRLFWAGEDAIAVRLHSTDVVTFHRDGTRTLATGGWETVTTRDRIRAYGSPYVVSERRDDYSQWCVRAEDDPNDPHPLGPDIVHWRTASRSIPKPFTVADPGPEPVDDREGCIAGHSDPFIASEYDAIYGFSFESEPQPWEYVSNRGYPDDSSPRRMIHRSFLSGIAYGETENNSGWGEDQDKRIGVPGSWTYKQCPHCKVFRARHAAWKVAMHGARWGRGSERGYAQMCELLDRFGAREAWQEAYITDFREVRATNQRIKAWRERNLIPFNGRIEVLPNGLVPLKAKRAHCRKLEREAIERRKRERVHARVHRERARLQAKFDKQREQRRQVKRLVAEALACSLVASLEIKRANFEGTREHRIANALQNGGVS